MQKAKRILAVLLVLSMLFSMIPNAFAADEPVVKGPEEAVEALSVTAALPAYKIEGNSYAERAVDLVSRMTLTEKAYQTAGYDAPAIPRLGVATYMWWNEALHGYNQRGWFGMQTDGTSYPSSYSMGASWDKDLYYQEAVQIGAEIRERVDDNRYNLSMFSPNINLARDPRWGRNDESYGEDPFLVGTMASQFVNGVEGKNQDGTYKMLNANGEGMKQAGTTIKHYAANNSEKNRYTSGADDVTIREMREYYTRAARIVIQNADVSSVMMAYSSVSGIPISYSSYYMDTILRQSYGFSGYIVSDCDSIATSFGRNVHKNNPHTGANYEKGQAYANAMANGLDLQCNAGETDSLGSYGDNYQLMLGQKTDKGIFTEAQFEVSAARLMYKRMQFGEFDADNYYADQGAARLAAGKAGEYVNGATGQTAERIALADETSRSTIVLLKNEANALPVTADEIMSAEDTYDVAIVGSNAQSEFLGGYSSSMGTNGKKNVVTIEKAIKTAFADAEFLGEDAAAKASVTFYSKTEDIPENVDLAVVAIGEGQGDSREDGDRMNINMKAAQLTMFEEVLAKDPAKLVVVMETYGQIQMPDTVLDNADAILWSGFNGIRKGTGFGEAITGKNNPSGRMNATWLKDAINDTPDFFSYQIFPDEEGNGGRSYMYNVEEVLWPFGYGLSYSDIVYAPAASTGSIIGADNKNGLGYGRVSKDTVMNVTFQMTNTNGVAGKQVAEVYVVSPGAGKNNLPLKRLVGFDKVFVPANGTVTVSIPIHVTDFAFFNEEKDCYELPTGNWQIWVAKSSAFDPETDLCENFEIEDGAIREDPTVVTVKPCLASDAAIGVSERVIFPLSANAEDNIILPNLGVTMANEKLYGTRVINNVPGWDIGVDAQAVREYTLGTADGFTVPDSAQYVDRLEAGKEADELPMVGTKFELPADYIVSFESNKPEVVEVVAGQLVMQAPGTATITATVTGPNGASASTEFSVCVTGSKALTGLSIGGNEVEEFDPDIYAYFVDLPAGFEANDAAAYVQASAIEGAKVEYSVNGEDFAEADGINPETAPGMVYVRVSGDDIAPLTYSIMFGDVDNGCEHNYVVSKIVEPTCLTDGYTSKVCTECYKMTKTDIVPALGHDFVNGRCTRCYVKDPAVQAVDAAFAKADTIEPGKQYVVVAKASGKALVNAGAVILGEDVTVEGGLVVSEVAPDMVWTVAETNNGYFLSCGTEGLLSHGASSGGMFGGGNAPLATNAYTAATVGANAGDATWMLQNGSLVSKSTGGYFATGYVPVYNADSSIFEAASGMDFSWGGGESALVTLMKGNPFEFYEVAPYMTKTVELNNAGYVTSIVYTGAKINVTPVKTLLELDVDDFEIEGQTIYSVFAEKGKLQLNVYPFKAEDVVVNYVGDLDLDLSIDGDYETAAAKVLRPRVSYTVQTLDAPLHAGPNICIDPESPTGYTVKFLFKAPEKAAIAQMEGRTIVGWTYEDVESVQFNGDLALRNANDFSDTTVKQPEEYEPGWMRAGSVQAEMTKIEEGEWAGYWYYELPLAAGANQYWFYCNGSTGKWYPDPANPAVWGPGCTATYNEDGIITRRAYNSLYVPYDAKQDYELLELRAKYETPRTDKYAGTLTWELIEGEDMDRTISVYLPYNYDANREEPYKTIYMTPAYDQDEADWFGIGSCQNIMDNLIANGDVDPDAIIVSVVAARDNKVLGLEDLDGDDIWEFGPLFDIVIPYIEENYNVSTEGADRAIGGHYQTAGSLIRFLGNTEGRSIEEFGYYLMVSTGKGADIDDVYDGASWNGNDVIVPADEVVKGRYFFSNGSTEGKLNMGTLPQSGAKYIYYQPPGGHDFNCWDQAAREYFKALWNDEAWAMLMTDIYFNKAAFADRYDVVNQASAKVTDAGLTVPSSTNRFETEKRADVVEIPVEGDNWTATVKFTCTSAGFTWGNPTENFVFLVGDDYDATLGLRGTTASTKGYLNGADAGQAGSGFKANNVKYYRIQKVGDTFICSVSDNDFDYEVVYTAEDTGIVGKKLYIDAYNTSSWAFGAASYTLDSLSFADPCDHEVETEVVEPTCTEDGYTIFSCAICGKSYKGNTVPAAHKRWATDKGVVTAPTCTEAGYTTYVCTECGESFTEPGAAALGHDWVAGDVIAPTCTVGGYTEYSCSRCEATKQDSKTAATGHAWGEETVIAEATETEFGSISYKCTNEGCEETKTVSIVPTGLAEGPTVIADPESPTGYTVKFLYKNETAKTVTFCGDIAYKNDADLSDNGTYTPFEYKPGYMRSATFTDAMVECADGYWFYELPLSGGANQYWFYVDGNTNYMVPDPVNAPYWSPNSAANKNAYNAVYVPYDAEKQNYEPLRLRAEAENPKNGSNFLIPENYEDAAEYEMGTWSYVNVPSLGANYYVGVYLPYGYDPDRAEPYKTIYICHGGGQDESDWVGIGSVQNIMDNLAAEGRTEPAVIIAPNINAINTNSYKPLLTDIIPFVEENYNVSTDKMDRAMAGLSMGGMATMSVINSNPVDAEGNPIEKFGYYGPWSGGNSVKAGFAGQEYSHILFAGGHSDFGNMSESSVTALADQGVFCKYVGVTGAHDFNTWCQMFRIFLEEYLWNPAAFGDGMEDIDFADAADADKYEIAKKASAALKEGTGVTLPSSTNRFEAANRADIVEIPVGGDNWTATVKFTCTNAGFGWGNPTENFLFLVGDSYGKAVGLRGTTASTKGYLNGADAGQTGSGFKANNVKYYRIQKVGDTFICSVSDNDFIYDVVYTAEDTGIIGKKLYIDAYNTSSWSFGAGASYNLQFLSFDDPCDHEIKAEKVDPTCTTDGYTTYSCDKCGKSYVGDTVPAQHKKWGGDKGIVTEPTCTEAGYVTFECAVCKETFTEPGAAALGHDWIAGEVIAPTCTVGGYTNYSCSRCDATKQDSKVAALGHVWEDGTVTLEATETEFGEFTYTCSAEGCEETKVVKILPTGGDLKLGPNVFADPESPTGYTVKFLYENKNAKSVTFAGDIGLKNEADPTDTKQYTPFEYKPGLMRSGSFTAPMTECKDGIWYYELPLAAGANQYWFYVDGNTNYMVPDPANAPLWSPNSASNKNAYNAVYVPYDEKQDYEPMKAREVENPRNGSYLNPSFEELEEIAADNEMGVWSYVPIEIAGKTHYMGVYLPYGYDADREEPYKTIYMLHGAGQDESDWMGIGSVQKIMDNLAAEGRTEAAVIVSVTSNNSFLGGSYANIRTEILPFIEANYNVSTDPQDRAWAGLSMGSSNTQSMINAGFGDTFGYFGAFSLGNSVNAKAANLDKTHILFGDAYDDFGKLNASQIAAVDNLPFAKFERVSGAHDFNCWCQLFRIWCTDYLWNPAAFGDVGPEYVLVDELEAGMQYVVVSGDKYAMVNGETIGAKEVTIVDGKVINVTPDMLWDFSEGVSTHAKGEPGFFLTNGDSGVLARGSGGGALNTDSTAEELGTSHDYYGYWMVRDLGDSNFGLYAGNMASSWGATAYVLSCDGETFKGVSQSSRNLEAGLAANPLKFYAYGVCEHDYQWTEEDVIAPTCVDGGYTVMTCSKCGKVKNGNKVAALGHDWIAGEVIAPTCVDGGYTEYSCSRCDATKQDDKTAATGHIWDDGEVLVEATEDEFGAMLYTCTVDGCEATKEVKILPTGEDYTEGPHVIKDEESPTGYTVKFVYKNETAKSVTFAGDIALKNDADLSDSKTYTPFEYKPGLMRSASFTDAMVECADGYWFYELPLAGGANQYWFYVDGNTNYMVPDPVNAPYWSPNSAANKNAYNAVYVPYDAKQDYEPLRLRAEAENPKNGSNFLVPPNYEDAAKNKMGTWSYVNVPSLGANYYVGVYLPYGYDANRAEPYKTIYICHGGGQDESDWVGIGSVQNIMDNLAAAGKTEPAVIIAPNINAISSNSYKPLLTDVVPFVEENYNVSTDKMDRAMAGLSMGGMATMSVINSDPKDAEGNSIEKFGYYGPWSGGNSVKAGFVGQEYAHILFAGGHSDFGNMSESSVTALADQGVYCKYVGVTGAHDFNTWCQMFRIWLEDYLWDPASVGDYRLIEEKLGEVPESIDDLQGKFPVIVEDPESPTGYTGKFVYYNPDILTAYFNGDIGLKQPEYTSKQTTVTPFEYESGMMRVDGFKDEMEYLGGGWWYYELPLAAGANQYWFTTNKNSNYMIPDPLNHPDWSPASNWNTKNAYNAIYVPYDAEKQNDEATGARAIENPRTGSYLNPTREERKDPELAERYQLGTWDYVPYSVANKNFYMGVYLPYGYDENREEPYKTVYVLHGGGQDESDWLGIGSVQNIIDNLAANGEIEDAPVLIVPGTGSNRLRNENLEATFAFVEENYNVSSDRMDRAICGLSMGAMQVNSIIGDDKKRDEPSFGYYGPFSGGAPSNALTSQYLYDMYIYIGNGTAESKMNMSKWEDAKANYYYTQKSGAHNFNSWNQLFTEFVRDFAFQPSKFLKDGPVVYKDAESPTGYTGRFVYYNPDATEVTFAGDIGLRNYADPDDATQYTPFDYVADGMYDFDGDGVETPVCMMRSGAFTAPMENLGDGYWVYEVPLAAGANQYWFYVDGNTNWMRADPLNAPIWSPNSPANKNAYNAIYVPYDEKQGNELMKARTAENPRTDGKTGTWSYVEYKEGEYIGVYLPYGYDPDRAEPYKTIYMQHGGGQDESDWMGIGSVQKIMDNLAAEGRTEPAIIITPDSNDLGWSMWGSGSSFAGLYNEIIPFVEENYNVSTEKMDRAFAGLSMGSMVAQSLINYDASQFGYFGPWSGGASVTASAPNLQHTHILFAGGRYDFGNPGSRTADALAAQGFFTKYVEVAGAHDFNTWCQMFRIFCEDYLWNDEAFGDTLYDDMEYVRDAMEAAREAEKAAEEAQAAAEAAQAAAEAAAAEAAEDKAAAEAAQAAAEAAQAAAEAAQAKAEDAQAAAEAAQKAAEAADADAAKQAAAAAASAAEAAASEAAAAKDAAAAAAAQAAAQAAQAAAEAAQKAAEEAEKNADADAAAAKAAKEAAEAAQKAAEAAKAAAEAADADAAEQAAASAQSAADAAKQAADAAKAAAEAKESADDAAAAQKAAEEAKAAADAAKAAAEAAKKAAEEAAADAAADKAAADAAKAAAELAQSRAEIAEKAAEAAQAAAEAANAEAAANAAKTAADAANAAEDAAEAAKAQAAAQIAQGRAEAAQKAAEEAQAKADEAAAKGEEFAEEAEAAQKAAAEAQKAAEAAKKAADASAKAADASNAAAAEAAAQAAKDAAAVADALKEVAAAKAEAADILKAVKEAELEVAKMLALTQLALAADKVDADPAKVEAGVAAIEAAEDKAAVDAALAAAIADLEPEVVACPSEKFADAPVKGNWAHEGIDYCIANDYMNGVSDTAFSPNSTVTRAQLVTILYRVAGEPEVTTSGTFSDVAAGLWYSDAIEWAAAEGVVLGVGEGKFSPNGEITREQIATILYRYSKADKVEGDLKLFPDGNTAGDFAVDALVWATTEGLIAGVKDVDVTYLAPKANASRAQIAAIIMRFLEGSYICG